MSASQAFACGAQSQKHGFEWNAAGAARPGGPDTAVRGLPMAAGSD